MRNALTPPPEDIPVQGELIMHASVLESAKRDFNEALMWLRKIATPNGIVDCGMRVHQFLIPQARLLIEIREPDWEQLARTKKSAGKKQLKSIVVCKAASQGTYFRGDLVFTCRPEDLRETLTEAFKERT